MTPEVITYLSENRIGVLSVLLEDGSPHAATVHYSHQDDPLAVYVSTIRESKKCQALLAGNSVKASFVVGFSEVDMQTLQMDGEVVLVQDIGELQHTHTIHFHKHPHAEKYKDDPDTAFLKFTPKWWRFSNYKSKPPVIVSSN